jgi:His-Xaa-Ser system radical SAM maturase HxsC
VGILITLGQSILRASGFTLDNDKVVRLSTNPERPVSLRKDEIYIATTAEIPPGFWGYISFGADVRTPADEQRWVFVGTDLAYLSDGDVIRLSGDLKRLRVLFRVNGSQNSLLLTERCNHYCLMCSQPPKTQDDSYLIENIKDVLRLASRTCKEIGFTGGEPTLLGEHFLELVRLADSYLPETALHVLTNGRAFQDRNFAEQLGNLKHHDIMLGVPLYSDVPEIHDYVVQAPNALQETLRGIINLNRFGVPVEIRVVLHQITISRLLYLSEFIARNLPFVSHVAFMGLEMTGFARANKPLLWVEPDSYGEQLRSAVLFLAKRKIRTSVYNLQHCLMPRALWPYMRKSISDWKNEYEPECVKCSAREQCGGFFSSFVHQKPKNIAPIAA